MKKILFSAMMLGAVLGSNFALAQTETSGREIGRASCRERV